MIHKISVKWLVLSVIASFAILTLVSVAFTSILYKEQAFSANQKISARFIEVASNEAINDLKNLVSELGADLQSDKTLRKQFKKSLKDKAHLPSLVEKLGESFHRRFQTAGLLKLQKIRVFDTQFKMVASSTEGAALQDHLDDSLQQLLSKRQGTERLQSYGYFWGAKKQVYYSLFFPIGGLKLKGYGEIVVEPTHNLQTIEAPLSSAIQLLSQTGELLYQSSQWPQDLNHFVLATYSIKNKANQDTLFINAAIDNSQLSQEMQQTRNYILLFFLMLGIGFMIFSVIFLTKTMFVPIESIVHELEQVADGNLAVEIDDYGIKEAFVLSNTLKRLVVKLSDNIHVIKDNGDALLSASNALFESTTLTKEGMTMQQGETIQVATAMEEMNATVTDVASSTSNASSSAQQSLDKCTEGKQTVDTVIVTVNQLSNNILQSEVEIKKLSEESQSISSILDVISGISAQTNLLALNAAIEAARAGEAGRGFAVVADEVRSLANLTNEAANDIRTRVEQLQNGADNAVCSMNTSRETTDNAVTQSEETGNSIERVSEALLFMNDINMQIATAAEEQTAVVNEINQNVVRIKDISEDNAERADKTAMQSQDLIVIAESLIDSVSYFTLSDSHEKSLSA
jgi:methyl-accepting chemotaxis protein